MNTVTFKRAVWLTVFLGIANFIYQIAADHPNYMAAAERTYFQAWAVLLAWAFWRTTAKQETHKAQVVKQGPPINLDNVGYSGVEPPRCDTCGREMFSGITTPTTCRGCQADAVTFPAPTADWGTVVDVHVNDGSKDPDIIDRLLDSEEHACDAAIPPVAEDAAVEIECLRDQLGRFSGIVRGIEAQFAKAIDEDTEISGADAVEFLVNIVTSEIRPALAEPGATGGQQQRAAAANILAELVAYMRKNYDAEQWDGTTRELMAEAEKITA